MISFRYPSVCLRLRRSMQARSERSLEGAGSLPVLNEIRLFDVGEADGALLDANRNRDPRSSALRVQHTHCDIEARQCSPSDVAADLGSHHLRRTGRVGKLPDCASREEAPCLESADQRPQG